MQEKGFVYQEMWCLHFVAMCVCLWGINSLDQLTYDRFIVSIFVSAKNAHKAAQLVSIGSLKLSTKSADNLRLHFGMISMPNLFLRNYCLYSICIICLYVKFKAYFFFSPWIKDVKSMSAYVGKYTCSAMCTNVFVCLFNLGKIHKYLWNSKHTLKTHSNVNTI